MNILYISPYVESTSFLHLILLEASIFDQLFPITLKQYYAFDRTV